MVSGKKTRIFSCPDLSQDMRTREHNTPAADKNVTGRTGYFPNNITETVKARIPIEILKSVLKRLKLIWAQMMTAALISNVC